MAIVSRTENTGTKSAKAKAIYAEMSTSEQTFTRGQVIERFISEAGMTKNSASSLYQKLTSTK